MKKTILIASCLLGASIFSGTLLGSRECRNHHIPTESNSIFTEKELLAYLHAKSWLVILGYLCFFAICNNWRG